jgi:hypothetical protein
MDQGTRDFLADMLMLGFFLMVAAGLLVKISRDMEKDRLKKIKDSGFVYVGKLKVGRSVERVVKFGNGEIHLSVSDGKDKPHVIYQTQGPDGLYYGNVTYSFLEQHADELGLRHLLQRRQTVPLAPPSTAPVQSS